MSLQRKHANGHASIFATIEHVVRKADGGGWRDNVVLAHGKCNSGRHGEPEGYQAHLDAMRKKARMLAQELEFDLRSSA